MTLTCFKSYDIRGRVDVDLNKQVACRIGGAVASVLKPGRVVVGYDPRLSSAPLADALAEGISHGGADIADLGLCGTEEVYFATAETRAGAGVMVTASHNPIDYNGMKLVGPGSRPLSEVEFARIHAAAETALAAGGRQGTRTPLDLRAAYAAHVAGFVDAARLAPLTVLVDAGNGAAGPTFDAVAGVLADRGAPLAYIRRHHTPNGTFPNGIPNPLLPENRDGTATAVRESGADLGVAWDGDFDRCFLFDEGGRFVDGEYVVALLAESLLARHPGAAIVHDPRVVWATTDAVGRAGGRAVASRTGHAFVKAAMREAGAIYGGEMSAHHYFRDFAHCDSGMIPWLLVVDRLSQTGRPLSALLANMRARFPSSGEINFQVSDPRASVERVIERLGSTAAEIDRLDGASLAFEDWRMNLRASNTEPLLRLNLETRGDRDLLMRKIAEISALVAE